jgi:hypothetical protein
MPKLICAPVGGLTCVLTGALVWAASVSPVSSASLDSRGFRAEVFFRLANPCPSTGQTRGACAGYVVDRIIPVACGGAEDPANMQWQTTAEAKAKDRWEKIGCRAGRRLVLPGQDKVEIEAFPLQGAEAPAEVQPLSP